MSANQNKKIGVFGGTFDPPHIAHLILAEIFVDDFKLDKCIFVPAYVSPFKTEEKDISPPEDRLEMVRLSIQDNSRFAIDDYEIKKKGVSYTYDTLRYINNEYNSPEIYLLIGGDQAKDFKKWKNWNNILSEYNLVIALRPGGPSKKEILDDLNHNKNIHFFDSPLLEISATDIRKRIKNGKSLKYILTTTVQQYIKTILLKIN